jgi:predicted NAD/FAD-binding protein
LEELDIYDPNDRGNDQTLDAPGSLCMFTASGLWPVLSTEYPLLNPITCIDFATYVHEAREVILQDKSWEMTLEDWISTLSVRKGFVDKVLYPWISASIGCTRANASRVSARSILQTFALAFENTSGSTTMNSKLGTGGNLHRLLDRIVGTKVHLDSPINELTMVNGKWILRSPEGMHGPFDAVVMNAPPYQSKHLLKPRGQELQTDNADNTSLPALARLLSTYEYFDARIVIHTDAKYTYRHKHLWAMYNGGIDGIECEGSVWYGRIHPKLPNGGRVDIFKSFASRRPHNPANILCERSFKHPLITPKVIRAARALQGFQGRNNLYFAGHFTTGMDLQEAAVYSGLKVAETLAPSSASIASLKKRLKARGRDGVSYEL